MTHIIDIGVNSFRIKSFLPFLFCFLDVLANPNITIETEDKIDTTRQSNEVRLETSDKYGRNGDKLSIS